jgi:hypothetical protein
MNIARFVSIFAMAVLLWVGCATTRDPLEGWRVRNQPGPEDKWLHQYRQKEPFYYYWNVDQSIIEDYKSYVETIPAKERIYIVENEIRLYEDGTGQHAIRIVYYGYGLWSSPQWSHVLIYDTDDKRIQTIKYKSGHSFHH